MKKLTKEDFIKRANLIHNNKYDYSLVEYINSFTKVKIICPIHGEFEQTPSKHLSGSGCKYCCREKQKNNTEGFIKKSKSIWGDKYDYRFAKYVNSKTKIKLICNDCGNTLEQLPNNHYNFNCYFCSYIERANKSRKTQEKFILDANKIHNNKYDYSKTIYINDNSKVKIICPIHGEFEQKANNHLNGAGCPICNSPKGELQIIKYLTDKNINFETHKEFQDLKDKSNLSYDFYLPDYNLLIEYNGIQHYTNSFKKPLHEWHRQLHHDWLKRKYAKKNNYKLLIIKYSDEILEKLSLVF